MGAGIAQLAAQTGAQTLLCDAMPEQLQAGIATIQVALERQVDKGRIAAGDASTIQERVKPVVDLDGLAACEIVIEAVPERLDLKVELFGRLADICGPRCVLATNTSSLSVTEIAAGTPIPERVVGLHFFNPAPVMRLAEVVPGIATSPEGVPMARAVAEAMGKHVIDAADVPGFLVNRVNRPFFLESLRIVQEQQATIDQVDRITRMAGGFRMGHFVLMAPSGIETNHAVAEGFYRQSYGEPRYQPSPLAARMVASGRLGRKTGQGWYEYGEQQAAADPEVPTAGGGNERALVIQGSGTALDALRRDAQASGWHVADHSQPWLAIGGASAGARAVVVRDGSLHEMDPKAAGLHLLPPLEGSLLIELTRTPRTDPVAAERLEEFVCTLGRHPEWVGDGPGLVLGRVVAQLVNEAAFLIGEGNGTPEDIDAGLKLGVNHPRGPVEWTGTAGVADLLGILDALHGELGEARYRAPPLLRRCAAIGDGLASPSRR